MSQNSTVRAYILSIILMVLLSFIYFHVFLSFNKDSDDANALLIGQNLFNGNWNLHGWLIAPDNFMTSDEILYGVLLKVFGFHPAILAAVPAILWALLMVLSGWLAFIGQSFASAWRLLPVVIMLGFLMLPGNAALNAITQSPAHVGTMCYVIVIFLVAGRLIDCTKIRWWYAICLFVLAGLATAGDPLAEFVGTAPVIVGALLTDQGSRSTRLTIGLSVCLGSLLGHEAIRFNMAFGGFSAIGIPMVFASAPEFSKNISLTVQGLLMIFGADFLGMPLKSALPTLLRLVMLSFIITVAWSWLWRSKEALDKFPNKIGNSVTFIDVTITAGIILNILAALLSTALVNVSSGRYFLPVLVLGSILLSRKKNISTIMISIYAITFIVSGTIFIKSYSEVKPKLVSSETALLSKKLEKLGLHDGYAPYWTSSIVTVWSKELVRVRALVQTGDKQLIPYRWQADRSWYPRHLALTKPFFVLSMPGPNSPISQASVLKTFGEPCSSHESGNYQINIYGTCTE